ncbi:MAG: hypothetical protein KAH77_01580, partial [Thiomargarita sp.]|nr:hypothetical protein [Thiomargarita sp.]
MAISDDVRQKFVEYVMLQVFDDQYIDRQEEKQILQEGIKYGIGIEEGLAIMRQLVSEKGLVLERDAEERAKDMLDTFAHNDGKVDQKEFSDALAMFKKYSKGKIPEPEMKRRLKKMIEENGW